MSRHKAPFYLALLFVGLLLTQALVLACIQLFHFLATP